MEIIFIEAKSFTRKVKKSWTANELRLLKVDLAETPDLGTILSGGDGIRKLRRRRPGTGKSGGVRVIYFWQVRRDTILLLELYTKASKSNLTDAETKKLIELKDQMIEDLKNEYNQRKD